MYTVSQCDVFRMGQCTYEEMLERSTYDHFWVVGSDVTFIPERFAIQRTAPSEIRLFRDSSTNTVAGVLMNRNIKDLILAGMNFSDSTFKGSSFMNINKGQPLDIVVFGDNRSLDTSVENNIIVVRSEEEMMEAVKNQVSTDYFYLIPEGFNVSEYFEFDARVTDVLDCHYSWFGERDGSLSHEHSIKLMNKRILLEEPSKFLRYEGYLELPGFSGTTVS